MTSTRSKGFYFEKKVEKHRLKSGQFWSLLWPSSVSSFSSRLAFSRVVSATSNLVLLPRGACSVGRSLVAGWPVTISRWPLTRAPVNGEVGKAVSHIFRIGEFSQTSAYLRQLRGDHFFSTGSQGQNQFLSCNMIINVHPAPWNRADCSKFYKVTWPLLPGLFEPLGRGCSVCYSRRYVL